MNNITTALTGPQHYREAERLLRIASDTYGPAHTDFVATAQVHATLAAAWAAMATHDQRDIENIYYDFFDGGEE